MPADDGRVDRGEIDRDYDRAASDFHRLLDSAGVAALHRRSAGTHWTNQELLFHMWFGYMIVLRLLVLVRVNSRLPAPVGRGFARLLNATTPLFDVVNYLGSAGGGRVFDRNRLGRKFDRVARRCNAAWTGKPSRISVGVCPIRPGGIRSSPNT